MTRSALDQTPVGLPVLSVCSGMDIRACKGRDDGHCPNPGHVASSTLGPGTTGGMTPPSPADKLHWSVSPEKRVPLSFAHLLASTCHHVLDVVLFKSSTESTV